ncbi:MAG: cellulose biosynthesis cyclic di-GMP-binding regulatory protein BcsB, partial [Anaerolineales bacterium]|nr:cellulose biosynthesis cyclic di-GMP-binding regulatory protein BcsB [Anaerolineales bacterium]
MKRLSILFALLAILLTVSTGNASPLSGQSGVEAGNSFAVEGDGIIAFSELGYAESLLIGPYDATSMYFSLPPTWQLIEGGKITLTYTHFLGGGIFADNVNRGNTWVGGSLLVFYNGNLIDTIVLDQVGRTTKVISIPEYAYFKETDDGRNDIRFFLDASTTCDYDAVQSSVLIEGVSFLDLAYEVVPPPTDLSKFPRPIYQPNPLVPPAALIVLPDNPTANELQAALTVGAGLGSITDGNLTLDFIQRKDLTEDIRVANHLIFVGLATKFPDISGVRIPPSVTAQGIKLAGMEDDDGVIQMLQSPWDNSRVLLVVSGNTEAALLKAAQALSTGKIIVSSRQDLSVVAATSQLPAPEIVKEDITLADLGLENFTMGGFGGDYVSFDFYISADQVLADDAYFDLITSHSDLMDLNQSGVTVFLNDNVIGSIRFSDEENQIVTNRIEILPKTLRRGRNSIVIISGLLPYDNCYSPDLSSTWVTVSEDSLLHLPTTQKKIDIGSKLDMKNYPSIFLENDNLEDFAVILPRDDVSSW